MTCDLVALCFDANDPPALTRFWAGILGWDVDADGATLLPSDGTGFRIRFLPTGEPRTEPNQVHFDLTSQSLGEQQATVERALALGGRHLDVGQLPEEDHVVLADPEGNEFCVIGGGQRLPRRLRPSRGAIERRHPGGGVLLEPGPRLAAGLGPGRGDRYPRTSRRAQDHVGRPTGATQDHEEQAAPRPRPRLRR